MGQMEKEESEEGVLEEEESEEEKSEEEKESEEEESLEEGEDWRRRRNRKPQLPLGRSIGYRYGGTAMDGHDFVHAYTYSL